MKQTFGSLMTKRKEVNKNSKNQKTIINTDIEEDFRIIRKYCVTFCRNKFENLNEMNNF